MPHPCRFLALVFLLGATVTAQTTLFFNHGEHYGTRSDRAAPNS